MFDLLYLGIAVVYIFLIGFVLKKKLTSAAHKYFFFFLVSLLLWHLSLYLYLFIPLGDWLLPIGRFNYAMGPLFTFGLLGFFYAFPHRSRTFGKKTEWGFWIWTTFLSAISLLTPLIDKNETYVEGYGPVVELGEWYLIYLVHMFAMPILTLALGTKKYFGLKGLEKKKFGLSFWIFVPTMLAFVVTNGIFPMYGIIWVFVYSPIFLIPIAASSAFAMYHYRFFDLPFQTLRVIRYGILLLAFSLVGVLGFEFLMDRAFIEQPILNFLIATIVSLVIMQQLDRILPEFTSSTFRQFRHHIQVFQSGLFTVSSYEDLQKQLETTFARGLLIEQARVLLVRDNDSNIDIPIYAKDDFVNRLEQDHPLVIVAEEAKLQGKTHWKHGLNALQAELCLPLYLDKRVIGLFILGKKSQDLSYSQEEINELLAARQYLEISFINILLKSNLQEENNLMKKLIKEKTEQLHRQNQQIRKVLHQQSDFIAVTAHEFRTPLNIALFQLADTLESYDHQTQVLSDMKTMEASLEKLKLLTQNLFDVQQYDLEKAELNAEETDVGSFCKDIWKDLNEIAQKKELQLEFQNELTKDHKISIDPAKIRQVLYNLASNAFSVSKAHQSVHIHLSETEKNITISVIDHGPGIPDDIKEDMFEKFRTAKVSKGMGLGLGLYLCKKIMDLHHGRISVKDTPEGGSTFTASLPKKS